MTTTHHTNPAVTARRPGEPAPDLTDYRLVHRAMTVDLVRLAVAAAELVKQPDRRRMAALRHYLHGVSGEIESHHHVEDDHVWPVLTAVAAPTTLGHLTEDHERLDPLMQRANELAATEDPTPQLAAVLREIAYLLARHVADEELEVFPLIEELVRVEDYARLQQHFRSNLKVRLLPFVVPWAISHATPEERRMVVAVAPWPLRVLLALFERSFRTRQRLLFESSGLSRADRKLVARMRRFGAVHTAVLRRTRGRIGSRWLGGSEILMLTARGRRSGRPHTVPLMYLPDGDDMIVAASQGGVDREPHWWLNLLADPRAEVERRGERFAVTAERVSADDRPQLWTRFATAVPLFDRYQAKVQRQIALVRLRRADAAHPNPTPNHLHQGAAP